MGTLETNNWTIIGPNSPAHKERLFALCISLQTSADACLRPATSLCKLLMTSPSCGLVDNRRSTPHASAKAPVKKPFGYMIGSKHVKFFGPPAAAQWNRSH